MLFSFHATIYFFLFLWLLSSFMQLWSEKIPEIISIPLNLQKLVLYPIMWLILEDVPYALEKNLCSGFYGCNVLKISVKSSY